MIYLDVCTVQAQIATLRYWYPELDADTDALEIALASETDFSQVMTKLIRFERDADAFASAIKVQEETLAERRARYTKQQQIYRAMLHALMDAGGQTTLRLPEATLSISRGRAGCTITDESALPDKFVKIERTPKKADIIAALLSGETVPGAEKSNAKPHLSIRI